LTKECFACIEYFAGNRMRTIYRGKIIENMQKNRGTEEKK
jgi:hypothetical protein